VQALLATPGRPGTTRIGAVPEPAAGAGAPGVRVRTLEVGVCGTDREISEGAFGVPPAGESDLVLGHELLGEVIAGGGGWSAGDLVTATVRRGCGRCAPCAASAPDECDTGRYTERGITALHGFAREVVVEDPAQLVGVPASLGRLGVLAEPASVCVRGIRHARTIGGRQTWRPRRALVIGAGAIGVLATHLLRLDPGLDVWTASRDGAGTPRAELVAASGARYVATAEIPLDALREEVGGFDLVIEAAGHAQVMLDVLGLLRRNGVGCLLGLDARRRAVSIDGPVVGVDAVLENRVLVGSVNAHPQDWRAAVAGLEEIRRRHRDALEAIVGLRVPPDRFADAFAFTGVKATLVFDGRDDACAPSR
jgi:threonine dehydrogenase-like Zn-dependent dehydrogenase